MSLDVRKTTLTQALSMPAVAAMVVQYKKQLLGLGVLLVLLAVSVGIAVMAPATATIPTFSVVDVVEDQTVTIRTANFPANQDFVVTMGPMGTRGINGTVVDTTNSGAGGAFDVTYNIPAGLRGSYQIAIRLQSARGYYAYNWFYNNTTGAGSDTDPVIGGGSTYSGVPTFSIESVVADQTVTIETNNFPPNREFIVTMGAMGTRGINGIPVATTVSGGDDVFTATYNIPAELHGSDQIAIRLESTTGEYSAHNWFYNDTDGTGTGVPAPTPSPTPSPPAAGHIGYPWFDVVTVQRDQSVIVNAYNLPPNQQFIVRMGPMGTRGINGIAVATTDSGTGGTLEDITYRIPDELQGSYRIAIRMESAQGSYAYNWFYNSTSD